MPPNLSSSFAAVIRWPPSFTRPACPTLDMKQKKRGKEPPSTADVGYPNFHPPRPGQDEDVLSDKHIKDDFLLLLPVPDDHQSASLIFLRQDAKGGRMFDQSVLADLKHP
ncbi:hypothetical protein EV424DRAFT_1575826 [Suillus variegatus]|nr:hypothetical protein EV424DRAFT_1575826 [Suillus variegatus]